MEIVDKLFKSQVAHLTTFMINIQRVFQKLVISQFVDSLKFSPPPKFFEFVSNFAQEKSYPTLQNSTPKIGSFAVGNFTRTLDWC